MKNLILFTVFGVLIVIVIKAKPFLSNPTLWFALAIIGFGICIQGFVYNMLNNNPVFRFDQDKYGKMFVSEYFMRGMRQQYAGEGYIVSALSLVFGMALLGLAKANTIVKTPTQRRVFIALLIILCFGVL